jgi:hypothetical protein
VGGGQPYIPPQSPIYSSVRTITRPKVIVTGVSPVPTQWAFWYLGGAPSIDGYYTQVALNGQNNYSGGVGSPTWAKVDQPGKISLSATSGASTVVTSQAASAGTVFDVSLVYRINGFSSEEFRLHINRPSYLTSFGPVHTAEGGSCQGYQSGYTYEIWDLWNYLLIEHAVNETFTNMNQLNGSNWTASADVWPKGDREAWITPYQFADTIYAVSCPGNTFSPLPVSPGSNGNGEGDGDLYLQATQKFYSGSLSNGTGQLTQTKTAKWFKDHGRVQ